MSENQPTSHPGAIWPNRWRRPPARRGAGSGAPAARGRPEPRPWPPCSTLLLGFAVVTQVRQTQQTGLSALRQDDLVNVLDDVNQRETRLEDEARQLQATQQRLQSGSNSSQAALQAAQSRLDTLGILTGTKPANRPRHPADHHRPRRQGRPPRRCWTRSRSCATPGPRRSRSARSGWWPARRSSTAPEAAPPGIAVDGTLLHAPYVVLAIGDPQTLQAALDIPGGVLETLQGQGADGNVTSEQQVQITALHAVSAPRYARPAPTPSGSSGG